MVDQAHDSERQKLREYVGYIWIAEEPGIRLSLMARGPEEAVAAVEAEYGTGHALSIWNPDDAAKPRSGPSSS